MEMDAIYKLITTTYDYKYIKYLNNNFNLLPLQYVFEDEIHNELLLKSYFSGNMYISSPNSLYSL